MGEMEPPNEEDRGYDKGHQLRESNQRVSELRGYEFEFFDLGNGIKRL
jgi:hypothetical protein